MEASASLRGRREGLYAIRGELMSDTGIYAKMITPFPAFRLLPPDFHGALQQMCLLDLDIHKAHHKISQWTALRAEAASINIPSSTYAEFNNAA